MIEKNANFVRCIDVMSKLIEKYSDVNITSENETEDKKNSKVKNS